MPLAEARNLLRREGRTGELVAQVKRAEQVHDVVHPLVEVRPVARSALIGRRRGGLEPGQELDELRVRGLAELLRVRVAEVHAERQHSSRQRENHQRLRDHFAREPARPTLRARCDHAHDRGRRAPDDRPQAHRGGKERVERAPPEIFLRRIPGVERLADLRLEARLLVEADRKVREHGELHPRLRVALELPALVPLERLAQVALAVGRVARPQSVEEPLERIRVVRRTLL